MNIFKLPIHPQADIFPLLPEDEMQELAADIKENGLNIPIAIGDYEGKPHIIDGRNRREACKIANLNVPEQVAILGLGDDDLVCDLASPPLSSVALSAEKAGYEAAATLDKLMNGEKVSDRRIGVPPSYIVTRQSTDILTIDDPYVAEALNFIYRHARREAIQVKGKGEMVMYFVEM